MQTTDKRILPMKCHEYQKHGGRIQFPCDAQPKLDGFRLLYRSGLGCWTRKGNSIDTFRPTFDTHGLTLDGELKLPGGATFQQTTRAIKKANADTPRLIYYVFDVVADKPWVERKRMLAQAATVFPANVQMVPSVELKNREQVEYALRFLIEAGHEGLILRNLSAPYQVNKRSYGIQKYKEWEDAEFTVTGVIEGEGKDKGCAILELVTEKGLPFTARPMGDYESRAELFRHPGQAIGKPWTIRFQGRSEDGVPRFCRAVAEREAWDQ